MALSEADLFHLLLAVTLLLSSAHALGALFARRHQPRVIGEIVGGLLLGPTVLGALAPGVQATLIPASGPAASALGALYQLGLIWLMFTAGTELRVLPAGQERRAAVSVALVGMALPFALGLAAFLLLRPEELLGPAGDMTALGLVFTAALAVTSIPVISRIMLDLGLLATPFARVVLGAAVIEDVVLFGVLGIAVGLTQSSAETFGLASLLAIEPGSWAGAVYYAAVVTAVLGGAVFLSRLRPDPASRLARAREDPTVQLLFLFATVTGVMLLSAPPLFGGLAAGLVIGAAESTARLKSFGLAFFVPLYFATVGLKLDLQTLSPAFFVAFFLFACAAKATAVYLGARLAAVPASTATDLAVAMNARGGPGIVLAAVALDADIIDPAFYASLVLLAILSSLLAGWWLERRAPLLASGAVPAWADQ